MTFLEKYGDTQLRALSWKQPFANLMLFDKIETRVWPTDYRGWVLICASQKGYTFDEINGIAGDEQHIEIIYTLPKTPLPTEVAIGIGRLVKSRPMTKADEDRCFVQYREPWLHRSPKTGKTAWKRLWCHEYADVQQIQPIFWKGKQGWSTVDSNLKQQIILL